MKKAARIVVQNKYNLFPESKAADKMTAQQYKNFVKTNVTNLLKGGSFMHDGKDDQVHFHLNASFLYHINFFGISRIGPIILHIWPLQNSHKPSSTGRARA